jgi:hypothetical protein
LLGRRVRTSAAARLCGPAVAAGSALLIAPSAFAAGSPSYDFHIPPKPLSEALIDFAVQSNLSIGGVSACAGRSPGLNGRLTVDEGLRRLLDGSNCRFRRVASDTVRILPLAQPSPAAAAPGPQAPSAPQPRSGVQSESLPVLQEVVVNATKRTAAVDQLPYAVSALDSEALQTAGAVDIDDVASQLASFSTTNLGPGRNKILLRGLLATDGTSNTVLYQDDRGTEFFGHMDRFLSETPGEGNPIPDAEAIRAAGNWLEGLGDMDKGEVGLPAVQHLFHQSFDLEKNVENPPTQDETIVIYPRQLPNPKGQFPIPIVGQGTGLEIHVDNKGGITGHRRVWRNVSPTQETLEILPYAELENVFMRRLLPDLGDYVAKVTDIKFGYFGRPEGSEQGFLLPAVVYEVDLINPATAEITAHRQVAVPASRNQPEDLEDPAASGAPPAPDDTRSADTVPALYGDIDGDGDVDAADAALAMKMFGGMMDSLIAPPLFTAGDVAPKGAPDGRIAMNDSLRILRSIFQLDDISNGP